MRPLIWIAGDVTAGAQRTRTLVANYLLDAPAESARELYDHVPELVSWFHRGRQLPLDGPGPVIAATTFLPDTEVLRRYHAATAKIIYQVRDPRDSILGACAEEHVPLDRLGEFAKETIADRSAESWRSTWSWHLKEWTSPQPYFCGVDVCIVRFEDVRSEPAATLEQIIDFVGIDGGADRARVRRAVENSTAEKCAALSRQERSRGIWAFRDVPPERPDDVVPPASLAHIGDDVEAAYLQLLRDDTVFHNTVRRFGYAS